MQMKLELVPLPVSDVDRAIAFYEDKLGFKKDFDVKPSEGVRIVQLTPEGSGCSVGFGTGLDVYAGEPGSVRGLHLAVEDIAEARAELSAEVSRSAEIQDFGGGVKGADFTDPDENTFEVWPGARVPTTRSLFGGERHRLYAGRSGGSRDSLSPVDHGLFEGGGSASTVAARVFIRHPAPRAACRASCRRYTASSA